MDNNDENKMRYSNIKGTGTLSAVIFSITVFVLMWIISLFVN